MANPFTPATEAAITQTPDGYIIRFERFFKHSILSVWDAISKPENLAVWLAEVSIDPVEGGKVSLQFSDDGCQVTGNITQLKAPKLLEYTWTSSDTAYSVVRWELFEATPDTTRLVLTHHLPELNPETASGWHYYLIGLTETINGERTTFRNDAATYDAILEAYVKKYSSA